MFTVEITNGIDTLNNYFGSPDWQNDIDLADLDMRELDWCILGQLFGSYDVGMETLELDYDGAVHHGFAGAYSPALGDRYNVLTSEWRHALSLENF